MGGAAVEIVPSLPPLGAAMTPPGNSSPSHSRVSPWRESFRMAGFRGVLWGRDETLDLLALWGEQKVQAALRQSHRNLESYEGIARGMAARGHRRTAVQCRTKTKGLRLAYRRTLTYNSRPGHAKATCPYFRELDRILRGDASGRPRRVGRGLLRGTVPVKKEEGHGPAAAAAGGPQELISIKVEAVGEAEEAVWRTSRPSGR